MKRMLIILTLIALCCSGCAKQVDGGVVIDKRVIPSHTENTVTQYTVPTAGNGMRVVCMPSERVVPEEYEIVLNVGYSDGSVREKRKKVSKELYDSINIGDSYGG